MAVIPMWQVDRDKSMHTSKSEADKHDLMLEIAEQFAAAVKFIAADVTSNQAEAIGLFLSKHRDAVTKLCKGSGDALAEVLVEATVMEPTAMDPAVTPIRAAL
jgi:uncharacterized protein